MSSYQLYVSVVIMGFMTLISSCKPSNSAVNMTDKEDFNRLVAQLENRAYRIDVEVVFPFNTAATTQVLNKVLLPTTGNSASRIEVRGEGHYIEIQGDSIKASLPYFGEQRQSANSYGKANLGIEIEGVFEDYELLPNEKKNNVRVKLMADDGNNGVESYDVVITSFPRGHVSVGVFSSHRTSIRYSGAINDY